MSKRWGLVLALLTLAVPASAQGAPPAGSLSQLSGVSGCNQLAPVSDGCTAATGVSGAISVAVSPDGLNLYAIGHDDNAVAEFKRDPSSGALTQLTSPNDCIGQNAATSCTSTGRGLVEATQVTVSADGKNVYVASTGSPGEGGGEGTVQQVGGIGGSVAVFSRNTTKGDPNFGALTQLAGGDGCLTQSGTGNEETSCTQVKGIGDADGIVISSDNANAYVSSGDSNAVAEFRRNTTPGDPHFGALTQLPSPNDCIGEMGATDCTTTGKGLGEAFSVAISPNAKSVYVASQTNGTVAVFSRDGAAGGALTQLAAPNNCVGEAGADGCATGRALTDASALTVSPDNKNVYVAATEGGALAVLTRDLGTGALSQPADATGCLQASGGADTPCTTVTGISADASNGVAVSPDGANAYVTGETDIAEFMRSATTGALTQLATPNDCLSQGDMSCGTSTARATKAARAVVVSPDGEQVYSANGDSNAVAAFERADPPPGCANVAQPVAHDTPTVVTLACSDPELGALTRALPSGPAHGKLGPIDPATGRVTYTPNAGFSGPDSFTFQASDGSETSNLATATLTVAAAPPPPPTNCLSKRHFRIRLRAPRGVKLVRAIVKINGKRVHVRRRHGKLTALINLVHLPRRGVTVTIVSTSRSGHKIREKRHYHTCHKRISHRLRSLHRRHRHRRRARR